MKKKLLYLFLLIGAITAIATCARMTAVGQQNNSITGLTRAVDHAYLGSQAYMGGSVLYNPKSPARGHIDKGAVIALRLSNVQKQAINSSETVFTDDGKCRTYSFYRCIVRYGQ